MKKYFFIVAIFSVFFTLHSCDEIPTSLQDDLSQLNDSTADTKLDYVLTITVDSGYFKGTYTNDIKNSQAAPIFRRAVGADEHHLIMSFVDAEADESLSSLFSIMFTVDEFKPQTLQVSKDSTDNFGCIFNPEVDTEFAQFNMLTADSVSITLSRLSKISSYTDIETEYGVIDVQLEFSGVFSSLHYTKAEEGEEPVVIEEEHIRVSGSINTVYKQ